MGMTNGLIILMLRLAGKESNFPVRPEQDKTLFFFDQGSSRVEHSDGEKQNTTEKNARHEEDRQLGGLVKVELAIVMSIYPFNCVLEEFGGISEIQFSFMWTR